MPKILLASSSFLRRFIMEQSKLPHEIISADIDETVFDDLDVAERVVKLAEKKCEEVTSQNAGAVVIAADTLTADESGNVYTKLTGTDDPFAAALSLSGKTIRVFTGCAIYSEKTGIKTHLAKATVRYSHFSEENLRRLAEGDNPNIRSGALGVFYDAPGFTLVEHIEGSYTGAFGLPMEFVYRQLEELDYFNG